MKTPYILYVDASICLNEGAKVSFYDPQINHRGIIWLPSITNTLSAESHAIAYAVRYAKTLNLEDQRVHILSESQNAINTSRVQYICRREGIEINWIPRELNDVVDDLCIEEITIGKDKIE